jgi:hypothetical protein
MKAMGLGCIAIGWLGKYRITLLDAGELSATRKGPDTGFEEVGRLVVTSRDRGTNPNTESNEICDCFQTMGSLGGKRIAFCSPS